MAFDVGGIGHLEWDRGEGKGGREGGDRASNRSGG